MMVKMLVWRKVLWAGGLLAGIALGSFLTAGHADQEAHVYGTVFDCFQRKVIQIEGLPVYVYAENEQAPIWRLIKELREKLPKEFVTSEGISESFKQYLVAYDELVRMVEKSHSISRHTKTNEKGEFVFRRVQPGLRYLILAIDTGAHDTPTYYQYVIAEKLQLGKNQFDLWMTPESGCTSERR